MKKIILIAEDNHVLRKAVAKNFEAEGYNVVEAADGKEALDKARNPAVDLLILDIMMPKMNGYDVCKSLRNEKNDLPVIMLTARGTVDDKIDGFDSGADDYVVKPFSIDVLFKRVEAILRRKNPGMEQIIKSGDWEINFDKKSAICKKQNITFSAREFEMLELLIQKKVAT
jgi:DNA-binding response OmpR family regulator